MPSFLAKALVQSFLDRSAGSTDPDEENKLKKAVASFLAATRGCTTDLKVSLHHGRWPAIYNTFIGLRVMRNKALRVGVVGPTDTLAGLLQLAGVEFIPLLPKQSTTFKLSVAVLDAMDPQVDVIYMSNPTLPTGEVYSKEVTNANFYPPIAAVSQHQWTSKTTSNHRLQS